MQPADTGMTPETVTDPALKNDATPVESAPADNQQAPAEDVAAKLAAIQKERDQIAMERNNLRKKIEEAETNALKEKEDYKALYEKVQAELEAKSQEEAQKAQRAEADKFREDFIAKQPESLRKYLTALVKANPTNFLWSDATSWEDAGHQLEAQAKAFATEIGLDLEAQPDDSAQPSTVHGNNPMPSNLKGADFENMSWQEMEKLLPKANR